MIKVFASPNIEHMEVSKMKKHLTRKCRKIDTRTYIGKGKMGLMLLDFIILRSDSLKEEIMECRAKKKKIKLSAMAVKQLKADVDLLAKSEIVETM